MAQQIPHGQLQQQHIIVQQQQQQQYEIIEAPVAIEQHEEPAPAPQPPRRFDPVDHDLSKDFRLTSYSESKGWGCKVPRDAPMLKLLEEMKDADVSDVIDDRYPNYGKCTDLSVTPLDNAPGLSLVQTTDFFYPLVDDPYMLGVIACASILNKMYVSGVMDVQTIQMMLGVPKSFTEKQRDAVLPFVMRGFKDKARDAGCIVTGGQTVINPWMFIGGIGTSVIQPEVTIIPNFKAILGDVLVLTKPLGTQIACTAHQWLDQPDKWKLIQSIISKDEVETAYEQAMYYMGSLNRKAASLMKMYNAHACTVISGLGILDHAKELAEKQESEIRFVIHNLPVISGMNNIAKNRGSQFQLTQGKCPEPFGGLLIAFPRDQAAKYASKLQEETNNAAWIIGIVDKGQRTAQIIDKPRVIPVTANMPGM